MVHDSIFIRSDQWVKQNDEHPMLATWLQDTESILDDVDEIYEESPIVFVTSEINQMVWDDTVIHRKGMKFEIYPELLEFLEEKKPFIQYIVTVKERDLVMMTDEEFYVLWCFDVEDV